MGGKLPRIVGLSFEVRREFLVDTIHGVVIDSRACLDGGCRIQKKPRIGVIRGVLLREVNIMLLQVPILCFN